jgi:ribonuclease HII
MSSNTSPTNHYESELHREGLLYVAGVDEVGRGALAGPVVAAAVVFEPGCIIPGVRDSKRVREPEREHLYDIIIEQAICWGVGLIDSGTIDQINILQATFRAMRSAVADLNPQAQYLLVDGRDTIDTGIPCRAIVRGDSQSHSIAAASLVAKVTRDRIMRTLHEAMPVYGFSHNKGYGTAIHRQAIAQYGITSEHRTSFINN